MAYPKVKTFEDLKKNELLVPGTGAGANSEIIPHAFNNLAGTKFKIIAGYATPARARSRWSAASSKASPTGRGAR